MLLMCLLRLPRMHSRVQPVVHGLAAQNRFGHPFEMTKKHVPSRNSVMMPFSQPPSQLLSQLPSQLPHEPEASRSLLKKDILGGAGELPHEPTNSRSHSKPAHRQAATATHRPAPQPPCGKKPEWDDRCCTAGDDGVHLPVALSHKLEAKVAEERSL